MAMSHRLVSAPHGAQWDDALKVVPDAFAADPERLARFAREAQILASLNHPNIAIIHGLEEADGVKALVSRLTSRAFSVPGQLLPLRQTPEISARSSLTQERLWIHGSRATRRDIGGRSNGDHYEHQDHRVGQSILWRDTEKESADAPAGAECRPEPQGHTGQDSPAGPQQDTPQNTVS
jgi:serine/threonine protein kinase